MTERAQIRGGAATRRAALGLAAFAVPRAGWAQAWPNRPVRCLVGAGAGGTTDIIARLIAPAMSEALGQPFVVENRLGGGGVVATEALARSRPDGHTVMLMNNSHAAAAAIFRRLPYDSIGDFAFTATVATGPLVVLAAPGGPFPQLRALLDAARARPEALNVATIGVGSTQHFVSAALEAAADVRMTHVPYGTTPAALVALRNGEVEAVVETVGAVLGQVRAGEARALAVSSAARSEVLPEVPSFAESGLPGFDLSTWYVLSCAAGTPAPVVEAMNAAMGRVLAQPALRPQFAGLGLVPGGGTPEEAREMIVRAVARAREIRATAGMPQQ